MLPEFLTNHESHRQKSLGEETRFRFQAAADPWNQQAKLHPIALAALLGL